jgi:hypothetical protein
MPGKVLAKAEALTGPTTPPGKRVQTKEFLVRLDIFLIPSDYILLKP